MTEYEQQQVTEYYVKGYSISDIMLLMPFTRAEIKAVIKSHGCEKRQKVTRGVPTMIMEDVRNGETDIDALAEKYHRSKATIYRWTRTGHQKPHSLLPTCRKGTYRKAKSQGSTMYHGKQYSDAKNTYKGVYAMKDDKQAIKEIMIMLRKAVDEEKIKYLTFDDTIRDMQILNERKRIVKSFYSNVFDILEKNGYTEEEIWKLDGSRN